MSLNIHVLHQEQAIDDLPYYFAKNMGIIADEQTPSVLVAAAMAFQHTLSGHVCLDLRSLQNTPIMTPDDTTMPEMVFPRTEEWLDALQNSPLVSDGTSTTPLVLDENGLLYLAKYWRYQDALARELSRRATSLLPDYAESSLNKWIERLFGPSNGMNVSDGQREAARIAAAQEFTIITGGPGTGKTTTVIKIIALLNALAFEERQKPLSTAILAPTGKAAARLEEALGHMLSMEPFASLDQSVKESMPKGASTIHRALQLHKGGFGRGERREPSLPADLVVVDEASMVDLATMHSLVTSIRRRARLIIMGDKDQLASVESGAVMADIHDAATTPNSPLSPCLAPLTFSHRFDETTGIGRLSKAINAGDTADLFEVLDSSSDNAATFVEALSLNHVTKALETLAQRYIFKALATPNSMERLSRLNDFSILTAHRKGPWGQDGINAYIERILEKEGLIKKDRIWYAGRPIMVTQNDYATGLFNGDIGLIVPAEKDPDTTVALFQGANGHPQEYSTSRLPPCDTVWAMTIHKSQGSEFDHVAIVLPERRSPIITRELLYTGVTRAKKTVTVFAPKIVLKEAVQVTTRRTSGLKSRLLMA